VQQFDAYIKSIVKDLNISQKQKDDLADEFRDHLEMLAKDYINKGDLEETAIVKAIENFGNDNYLKMKLSYSLNNYRTTTNILFGLAYLAFIALFIKILISNLAPGIVININSPLSDMIFELCFGIPMAAIIFSPLGYFLPIIFKKMNNVKYIIGVYVLLEFIDIGYGVHLFNNYYQGMMIQKFLVMCLVGFVTTISSGILGFSLLNLVNRKLFVSSKSIFRKS
jgi:hypothetical protein